MPYYSCCIISFPCLSGFGMLLLGETQKKHPKDSHPQYQTCPLHSQNFGTWDSYTHPHSPIHAKFGMQVWINGVLFHTKFQTNWHTFLLHLMQKPQIWPNLKFNWLLYPPCRPCPNMAYKTRPVVCSSMPKFAWWVHHIAPKGQINPEIDHIFKIIIRWWHRL